MLIMKSAFLLFVLISGICLLVQADCDVDGVARCKGALTTCDHEESTQKCDCLYNFGICLEEDAKCSKSDLDWTKFTSEYASNCGYNKTEHPAADAHSKRACWFGANYGCTRGYCWMKCTSNNNGFWCWIAWDKGNGDWTKCSNDEDCRVAAFSGGGCGQGSCSDCGCSCH